MSESRPVLRRSTSDPYDTLFNMREAVHIDIDYNLIWIKSSLRN
jgi:hypothetical protein